MQRMLLLVALIVLAGCAGPGASPPAATQTTAAAPVAGTAAPEPTAATPQETPAPPTATPAPGSVPAGTAFVIRLDRESQTSEIVHVPPAGAGGAPQTLASCKGDSCTIEGLALAPDGTRLAYVRRSSQDSRTSLIVRDLKTQDEQELVSGVEHIDQLTFAPDGQRLGFLVGNSGQGTGISQDLYMATVDGAEPANLLADQRFIGGLRWSPDSSQLWYSQATVGEPPQNYGIFQLALEGGDPVFVLERAQLVDFNPAGDQLLVRTELGPDRWGLGIFTLATAELRHFELAGWSAFQADWSPTGTIVATSARSSGLPTAITAFAPDTDTTVPAPVETGLPGLLEPRWIGAGDRVAMMSTTGPESQLVALQLTPGATSLPAPEVLADNILSAYSPGYAVMQ